MPELQPLSVRIVADRYALFDEIGSGGMATVHIGRLRGAAGFMRTVAIKRLHPALINDPEFVSMLIDEARLAARIRHPNVVQTLDVVLEGRELFVVMEYIHGESVSHLMRLAREQEVEIPYGIAVTIIADALQGLHAAHETKDERGGSLELVHRDVSPQNILVGTDGLSRVLDFGIAKSTGSLHISQIGRVKGKFAYIAPEQIADTDVGRQADVYSTSVVLWEMLTGRRLFHGESQEATLAQVLAGDVAPPSSIVSDIPRALDAVVLRGLARTPASRFPTAKAMAQALKSCCKLESDNEVAAWLERLAEERLQTRADSVARMERNFNASEVSELRDLLGQITDPERELNERPAQIRQPSAPRRGNESRYSLTVAAPAVARREKKRKLLMIVSIGAAVMTAAVVLWLTRPGRAATDAPRAPSLADSKAQVHATPNPIDVATPAVSQVLPQAQASETLVISADENDRTSAHPPAATARKAGRKGAASNAASSKSSKSDSPFSQLGGRL